jgi:hypothetical protein
VRVSLAQTAVWLRGLGLAGEDRIANAKALSEDEIGAFSIRSDTGFGAMKHLRPRVLMSVTPPRWKRAVVPLGTNEPEWPSLS